MRRLNPRPPLRLAALLLTLAGLGCAAGPEPLMDTPLIWHVSGLDPFAHLDAAQRTNPLPVFYATRRQPQHVGGTDYGADVDARLHLGTTHVSFGPDLTWAELARLSRAAERPEPVELVVRHAHEEGTFPIGHADVAPPDRFLEQLHARLGAARDPDLLVYVHGAKVDFYRCVARTGELIHFAGRDVVPIVFDWPTHTNILSYVFGDDAERARRAGHDLAALLELLAGSTDARRIHVLSYSAGAKVLATALAELSGRWVAEPGALRLGTVVFAAGDLERAEFVDDLPAMHALVERITVTMSDDDGALHAAQTFMGGGERLGDDEGDAAEFAHDLRAYERLEIVDVSWGREQRGFDITGHHYWHRHPWVTSDLILNLRGGLPAGERGLVEVERPLWAFPDDYAERAALLAEQLTRAAAAPNVPARPAP